MAKKQSKSMKRIKENKRRREVRQAKKQSALVTMPTDVTRYLPSLNQTAWVKAIAARDPRVWSGMIQFMHFFESHHYKAFGRDSIKTINQFVQLVYTALLDEEFLPSPDELVPLIQYSHIFQSLVAVSAYGNNDDAMRHALLQQDNLPTLLLLQNPRCEVQLDQAKFFEANPTLASMWFQHYMLGISSPTKTIQQNMYRHIEHMNERWVPYANNVSGLYFSMTYHCPEHVLRAKAIMNASIKKQIELRGWEINNTPRGEKRKSIGIITNKWHRNHAVYKSAGPLVEQWHDDHDLTLIWTGKHIPDTLVKDKFVAFDQCYFNEGPGGELNIPDVLANNNFDMIYFPDIGMSDESIWLSNIRMAPIQAVGYGHPDSTGANNEIDYFFGGDVEKDAVEDAYSETCVLVPGLAQEPAWPTAKKQNNYKDDGVVRINCVWGPDKYNHTLLSMLQAINETVTSIYRERRQTFLEVGDQESADAIGPMTHEIHLFASPGVNRYAALPAFMYEVQQMLPNVILHNEQEYYDYMENAEEHDFALNSFPFGCYNVLIESLWMGIPFLSLVGKRFYNRAGMYLNEQVGMPQNNFESPRDLINYAARLVTEPALLKQQRDHLASIDLKEKLFTLKGKHFLEALEYTLENHPFTETKIIGENE